MAGKASLRKNKAAEAGFVERLNPEKLRLTSEHFSPSPSANLIKRAIAAFLQIFCLIVCIRTTEHFG